MRRIFILLLLLAGSLAPLHAAEKIRVVTRDLPPFSFMEGGLRTGYAFDLWRDVAREAGFDYDVRVVGSPQEMVDALVNKSADVAIGALSVTSKREAVIDFSQPFYNSGLQILTTGSSASFGDTVWMLLTNLFNWKLLGAFALLVFVMLMISHFVWLYEHKVNPDMWPASYRHGLWESFWWTISTLLVGGADNKGPVGVGGRIVAIIWMLLSIVLVSLLTASFSATLTVNNLQSDITGPNRLAGRKVATIAGSTAASWLSAHDAVVQPCPDLRQCLAALKAKDVAAVVYDAPLLQHAVKEDGDDRLLLVPVIFDQQNYAIGLQQNSPLRERINHALLSLNEAGVNAQLNKQWFGGDGH